MLARCKNTKVYSQSESGKFWFWDHRGLYPVPERVIKIIIVNALVIIYPFLRCTLWKNNKFPSRMNDEIQITLLFLLNTKFHFREISWDPPHFIEKFLIVKKFTDVDTVIYLYLSTHPLLILSLPFINATKILNLCINLTRIYEIYSLNCIVGYVYFWLSTGSKFRNVIYEPVLEIFFYTFNSLPFVNATKILNLRINLTRT